MVGEVWKINGKTWYSEELINKIINKCKRTKEVCADGYAKNLLADDILSLLHYKDSKEEK